MVGPMVDTVSDGTSGGENPKLGPRLVLAALVIIVAGFIAIPALIGSDDASGEAEQPVDEVPAEGSQDASAAPAASNEQEAPVAGGFEPPSAPHLRDDEVALLFSTQIDTDATSYGVAYVANEDFVVLDNRGISVPDIEVAVEFDTVSNLALLANDGRTWAINPRNRDLSYLVSNSYVVVVSERPGTIAIIREDDRSEIGLMSAALPAPGVPLPEGADLLWVQGRGPLVMPRTGGTFEVSGLASSLEQISNDTAVAASSNGTIYESCDESLACQYFSQVGDDPLTELPFGPNTSFAISPDGALLVAADATATTVYDPASGAELQVFGSGPTAIAWAPDSSFVAIVKDRGLSIFYPESGEVVAMQLDQAPNSDALLVFASRS